MIEVERGEGIYILDVGSGRWPVALSLPPPQTVEYEEGGGGGRMFRRMKCFRSKCLIVTSIS